MDDLTIGLRQPIEHTKSQSRELQHKYTQPYIDYTTSQNQIIIYYVRNNVCPIE